MEDKLRVEIRYILGELIKSSTNSVCPFLIGNESDDIDWYEQGLKNLGVKLFKEGLIKTYPFDFTVQRLGRYGSVKFVSNKIYLGLSFDYFDKIEDLIKYIDTLGYFASTFKVLQKGKELSPENYDSFNNFKEFSDIVGNLRQIWVEIEAKYDIEASAPVFLYHLTLKSNLDKISKLGLIPKSMAKKSYHPDRIYIVDDINSLKQLLSQFSEVNGKDVSDYAVLKIEYSLAGEPKIYNDPNFLNFGYYLVDNIRPEAIVSIADLED